MQIRARSAQAAFTLVEIMMVVAIVAILAVLGIFGVRKYISSARSTEARNSLGQMAKDASTAYEKESIQATTLATGSQGARAHALCVTGERLSVPAAATSIQGRKYQSTKLDWALAGDVSNNRGFPCLKFSIDEPQQFQYSYTGLRSGTPANGVASATWSAPGDTFVATANGDTNGDGVLSTFSISGTVNSSYLLNTTPTIRETAVDE